MLPRLEGLFAAVHTPFDAEGRLKLDTISRQAEVLVRGGASGCFVCGTTGESSSLTVQERQQVAARWVDVAAGRLHVIIHVGHNCLADARELAAHAQQIGALAIAATPPSFIKPGSIDALVKYCGQLAAAAQELPFFYYHIPSMTHVDINVADFLTAAADQVPTLVGGKYTHYDLADFGRCLTMHDGRWQMLFGRDEMLLGALATGARAAIGTTYTFASPIYRRVIDAYDARDMATAQHWQHVAREMIAGCIQGGGLPAFKAVMKMIGVDCGPVRLPLVDIPADRYNGLRDRLESLGVLAECQV